MANPKNKWGQPAAPPPPMFFGSKERDLVKQVNDELSERVIGQTIAYYPISIEESNFNDTYGEALDKVSLPPVRVYAYVVVENEQTNEVYGFEYQSKLTVNFHRKRLTEDQNLYVRVGDFVQYGEFFYEIVRTYNDTRYYFGQVEHKFQISAECVRAREGVFRVMPGITRPTDTTPQEDVGPGPNPRAAPYPPLDADYLVVSANSKLPNERTLTAGSNIAFTDAGPNSTLTIATTSEFTASNARITGDLTVVGTLLGGSPLKISGAIDIVDSAGTVVTSVGSSSYGLDTLSASFGVVTNLSASGYISATNISASAFYGSAIIGASPLSISSSANSFTGSVHISGALSASTNISASAFYGDGSNITNLPAAAISSYTNPANNRVITSVDASTVTGEANLTFDGALLTVTGDLTASQGISASYFMGDGSGLTGVGGSPGGSTTEIQYNDAGSFQGSSNLTFDGTTVAVTGDISASSTLQAAGATILGNTLSVSGTVGIGTSTPSHLLTVAGASHLSGGLVHKRTAVASSYTASITDYILGVTSVPVSIEFDATSFSIGQVVVIKDESGTASSANPITLTPSASQTIDGSSIIPIESPYGALLLYSDGSNWFIY